KPLLSELQQLSDQASRQALADGGIIDPTLQSSIVQQSQGLPIWLQLALDKFKRLADLGKVPTARELVPVKDDVVQVVRQGLSEGEWQILLQLATTIWFDPDLFRLLVTGEFQTGYPANGFDAFSKFSFVDSIGNDLSAIHPVFRVTLKNYLANDNP